MTEGPSVRRAVGLSIVLLLLGCTDPRARPVAPVLDLEFGTSRDVSSPGRIEGLLYTFDADGIQQIVQQLRAGDSLLLDSTILLGSDQEVIRNVTLAVPRGLPIGTRVRFRAVVTDWVNFVTADSVVFTVKDTLP